MNANSYYGLSKNIFQKDVKVEDLYKSKSYEEGISRLEYLKEVKK